MAGPGSNLTGQRSYNTLINDRSKRTAVGANPSALAVADPSAYGAYASSIAGLQMQLAGASALAKAGIGAARGQFALDAEAAKQARIQGVTAAETSAIGRGVVGSSADLAARGAAVAQAAGMREQALATRASAVAQQRTALIGAEGEFYTGMAQAQQQLANAEAQAAIQRFQQGLYDTWAATVRKLNRGRRRDQVPPGQNPGYQYRPGDTYTFGGPVPAGGPTAHTQRQ